MHFARRHLIRGSLGLGSLILARPTPSWALTSNAPPLSLAQSFQPDASFDHRQFLVSEKYDGVRAYWDGNELWTRSGHRIASPTTWRQRFPKSPLDGELWLGRGRFAELSGLVRREIPDTKNWQHIHFNVFDLLDFKAPFSERIERVHEIARTAGPTLKAVKHWACPPLPYLKRSLDTLVKAGAEGLILRRADAPYRAGRSDAVLKFKPFEDDEARVVGYISGQGKYVGDIGALVVRNEEGLQFRVGTGLSDAERASPPPIGATITYRFRGRTSSGLPRFPSFLRVRPPE